MIGGVGVDPAVMDRTLDRAIRTWHWDQAWGWDFPMAAMTAARLGRAGDAADLLLMDCPKNRYLPNGHNWQTEDLSIYLPGNGGLLLAVAMCLAGWEEKPGPGLGRGLHCEWEGLKPSL